MEAAESAPSPMTPSLKGSKGRGLRCSLSMKELGPPSRVPTRGDKKVRVVGRVRPFLASEQQEQATAPPSCLQVEKTASHRVAKLTVTDSENRSSAMTFELDGCYESSDSTDAIFSKEVEPLLQAVYAGYNATIFAYGATGSGKTHTMQGFGLEEGVMPLTVKRMLEKMPDLASAQMAVSYLEVYMDRCYDLLVPKQLAVLEDGNGKVVLPNLAQVDVRSMEDFKGVFAKGCERRHTGATGLNDRSSRSHGVLLIEFSRADPQNPQKRYYGKLHLVDLAGNEDNRKTGNGGVRMTESSCINKSLFALSKVIHALNGAPSHVPYRDSKLTRLLQDSLGGNSCSVMIACLNPGVYQEALYTLELASKSRQVVNRFAPNDKDADDLLAVDMAAKLQQWKESKRRSVTMSSSVSRRSVLTPAVLNAVNEQPARAKSTSKKSVCGSSALGRSSRDMSSRTKLFDRLPSRNLDDVKPGKVVKPYRLPSKNLEDVKPEKEAKPHIVFDRKGIASSVDRLAWQRSLGDITNSSSEAYRGNSEVAYLWKKEPPCSPINTQEMSRGLLFPATATTKDTAAPRVGAGVRTLFDSAESSWASAVTVSELSLEIFHPYDATATSNEGRTRIEREEAFAEARTPANSSQLSLSAQLDTLEHDLRAVLNSSTPTVKNDIKTRSVVTFKSPFDQTEPQGDKDWSKFQVQCNTPVSTPGERVRNYSICVASGTPLAKVAEEALRPLETAYLDLLNTGNGEELKKLKGIGEVRATSILALREEYSTPFNGIEDLQKIGLTEKQARKLFCNELQRQFATLEGEADDFV